MVFPLSELVFTDHKRTVNRIQFHPVERDILLSGSQDGTVKFFVRQNVLIDYENNVILLTLVNLLVPVVLSQLALSLG